MVSRFEHSTPEDPQDPSAQPSPALHNPAPRVFKVIVPVFLQVTLTADDELAAEVHAIEAIRAIQPITGHQSAKIQYASIITPLVS